MNKMTNDADTCEDQRRVWELKSKNDKKNPETHGDQYVQRKQV
jgi:hypothetical protein